MSAPTIPRPGVKVFQTFQAASPTIIVPNLQAGIAGVANQVVEAVDDTGVLDAEAFIALPARFAFKFVVLAGGYTALESTTLILSFNNGPAVTFTFPASPAAPTPLEVKTFIDAQEIPGIRTVVETNSTHHRVVIETTQDGQFASIDLVGGTALVSGTTAAFDPPLPGVRGELPYGEGGYRTVGLEGYSNMFHADITRDNYPDPRNNIDELVIDYDTVRLFLDTGNSFIEILNTEGFLRGEDSGTGGVTVSDDGDGDNLSPYIDIAGAALQDADGSVTGIVDWGTLTLAGDVSGFDLDVEIDDGAGGVTVLTCTFTGGATTPALAIAELDVALAAQGSAVLSGVTTGFAILATDESSPTGYIRVLDTGTAGLAATLGFTTGQTGQSYPGRAQVLGTVDLLAVPPVMTGNLVISIDGDPAQTIPMPPAVTSIGAVVTVINNFLRDDTTPGEVVADVVSSAVSGEADASVLRLRSTLLTGGDESSIEILAASTAADLTALGLSVGLVQGNPHNVEVGDEFWVDGVRQGLVTEVVSGTRIRLDTELLLTFTGDRYYIIAKGLDNEFSTTTRPTSSLRIDEDTGTLYVRPFLFRDTAGTPTVASNVGIYLGYTALRQDVSPVGEDFNGLRIGGLVDLAAQLSPLDTQNPLGLGMFFALLNAPGIEVFGVGVDESSDTEPFGTTLGWARTFEFLESKDLYALAGMTHSMQVVDLAQAHVNAMSDPEVGLERMYFHNPTRPTRVSDTLVGSGALGNATAASSTFDTGIPNLPALIAGAGLGPGPYAADEGDAGFEGIFLKMESDTNNYLIVSVAGSVVTLNTAVVGGDAEGFWFDEGPPAFTDAIVDRPFSVSIRGAVVANLTEEATAYADIPRGYRDRRLVFVAPDQAKATIDGLEQIIDGFYVGAALAGKTSSKAPQDPLTNVAITGFSGVIGSTDRYSELQMTILDGGGLWVVFQEADGQPVITRHQLTTDMSTIEKREFSILTAVDFTAKFVRGALRNFIGRFNITTAVKDSVNTVLDGIGKFLTEQGTLASFEIQRLLQDPDQPDRLIVDATLGILYPLNEIKVTLII